MLVLLNEQKPQEVIDTLTPSSELIATTLSHLPNRTATSIHDQLAMAHFELGHFDEAWAHQQKSVRMSAADGLPFYSQESAYDCFVQGNIRLGQNNLDEALRFYSFAFKIRKQILGDHIQTAASCYRVADVLALQGNVNEASDLLSECDRMCTGLDLLGGFEQSARARSAGGFHEFLKRWGDQMRP